MIKTTSKIVLFVLSLCLLNYALVLMKYSLLNDRCRKDYVHVLENNVVRSKIQHLENASSTRRPDLALNSELNSGPNNPLSHDAILQAKGNKSASPQTFLQVEAMPGSPRSHYAPLDVSQIIQALSHMRSETSRLLGCTQIENLQQSSPFPQIILDDLSYTAGNGLLRLSNTSSLIPIVIKKFDTKFSDSDSNRTVNGSPFTVQSAMKEVVKLLRLQDCYGVPRLYGLCMKTATGEDIVSQLFVQRKAVKNKEKYQNAASLWYLVSRHDHLMTICNPEGDDCKRLTNLTKTLRGFKNHSQAALTVMLNTAKLFEQLTKRGIVLYDLNPSKFFIDHDLDIICDDVNGMFFVRADQDSDSARLLANTICKYSMHCPAIEWKVNHAPYAYSQRCSEISGLCGKNNQCWGVDSSTHGCLLSRWMFVRLHNVVSAFWPRDTKVSEIIRCASQFYPEDRCSWSYIREKLEELHLIAQTELEGS